MGVGDRSASLLDDHSQEKVRVIKYQLTSSRDTQRPMSDGGKAAPRVGTGDIPCTTSTTEWTVRDFGLHTGNDNDGPFEGQA